MIELDPVVRGRLTITLGIGMAETYAALVGGKVVQEDDAAGVRVVGSQGPTTLLDLALRQVSVIPTSLDVDGHESIFTFEVVSNTAPEVSPSRRETTQDEREEIACDWSDYRKDYGVSRTESLAVRERHAFEAGWMAGRHGDQSGVLR